MDEDTSEQWRIGDLAQATGLTVRTLHHYEHLGLLAPSRTDGNHRIYEAPDVRRLYRIRALRELGLSLEEIRRTLDGGGAPLGDVLSAHLAQAERELSRLTLLRDRLRGACERADQGVAPAELLAAIEATSRLQRHADRRRAAGRSPPGMEARWRSLGAALRACLEAGDAPSSPRAQAIARQARDGLRRFAGDDPEVLEALALVRLIDPPRDLAGWDPPLIRYLDRALDALNNMEDEP